jgi:hypothetical protein
VSHTNGTPMTAMRPEGAKRENARAMGKLMDGALLTA